MAGVELRSRSRVRGDFRDRLRPRRSSSRPRFIHYSIALGEKRAAADLLLGAALVSSRAWPHLSNRIRVVLGASRRAGWQQRNIAGESVPAGSSRTTWRRRLFSLANALLVQREQRL